MSTPNILRTFDLATSEEVQEGKLWYAEAQAECRRRAALCGVPTATFVGVVAALSPNNKWERNCIDAHVLCKAFMAGEGIDAVKVSTYPQMKEKAWSILEEGPRTDAEIIRILHGRKIVAFFRCIMGENVPVIDGHAFNIWRNRRAALSNTHISAKDYEKVSRAYIRAANQVDLKAYEVQAITWVVWRRLHGIT